MDFKGFVEHFAQMTCIISVEKKGDGDFGKIRIVEGNEAYIDSIGLARGNRKVSGEGDGFVPNSEYTAYIPHDSNFEDKCYRCAVLGEPIHEYIDAERYKFDINVFFLPLESDDPNFGYCTYTQVLIPKTRQTVLNSKINAETAEAVLETCIKLRGADDFKAVMTEIIRDIRVSCGAELCCVLLMDENERKCSVLCESKREGSTLEDVSYFVNDDFYALAETWLDTLEGGYCLLVQNEHDMEFLRKKNPEWAASFEGRISTLVLFPLRSRGRFLGYIWGVNFDRQEAQRIKDTLELTTYFIASEIASYQFVEKLRVISEVDVLTGVLNRNEMNNRITQLSGKSGSAYHNMGVIFVDLNGLKYVNDHDGHDAGDQLLKNASMILQSTFSGDEIFRAGGDEFMILERETTPEDMAKKIDELKMKSDMFDNVRFAAGSCFLDDGSKVREALKEADALMYEDKKKFYREHPEWARG